MTAGRQSTSPLARTGRDRASRDTPFGQGIALGRWFGIPVRARWSVLVALLLFAALIAAADLPARVPGSSTTAYWLAAAVTAPLLFCTLLLHELSHALAARHYGVGVRRITLWMLGGLTELEGEAPTPRIDAVIAVAGPLASLTIGAVCAGLARATRAGELVSASFGWLATINVVLGVFNLLPGAPLDGGRLVRAAMWWRGHDRTRAAESAAQIGRGLGVVLLALGLLEMLAGGVVGLWTVFLGWFILDGAATEHCATRAETLAGLTVRDAMTPTPWVLPDWSTVAEFFARATPAAAHQTVFPLTDVDGRFSGAVTVPMLAAVPPDRGATVRLRDLAPHQHLLTTTPDQDLGALLLPLHLRGGTAVVLEQDHPVGVVTDSDLTRTAALVGGGMRR